jgi:fibronectin type 3 domain-containing protein
VSGLQVTLYSNGDVALSWDASTQPNLRGYNVYRHIVSGNAIGALNRSPLANNRYIDTSAMRGYRYEYMVTAVSVKGLESAFATISVLTERDNTRDTGLVRD